MAPLMPPLAAIFMPPSKLSTCQSTDNWLSAYVSMDISISSSSCHAVRDAEDTGGRVGFWNIGVQKPHPHPDAIKLEQALHWLPRQIQHKPWAPQEDARLKHAVLRLVRVRLITLLAHD